MNERISPPKRGKSDPAHVDLPVAELEVLARLWLGSATAREIREAMIGYRPMTHGAIATLLRRLEDKRLVSKEKASVGKAFVYRANHSPQPTYRGLMGRIRERIFGGDGTRIVASLFDADLPSPEELEELEQLLVDLRAKAKRVRRGTNAKEGPK